MASDRWTHHHRPAGNELHLSSSKAVKTSLRHSSGHRGLCPISSGTVQLFRMTQQGNTEEAAASATVFAGIRAVAFDAVGTVMYPEPSVSEAYRRALEAHCGVRVDAEQVRQTVAEALRAKSTGDNLRTDEDSERRFWADLIREFCADSSGFQACFDTLYRHFADPANWRCFSDVAEIIQRLESQRVSIAIASNFDLRLNSVCDGIPELARLSNRVISSVVGWRKPAPPFFEAVSHQLNVLPEQVLFVGDDLINDVNGARRAGMQTAWIHRKPFTGADPDVHQFRTLLDIRVEPDPLPAEFRSKE